MSSWRPFASDFVAHTFDDFCKKHDKTYTVNPVQVSAKEKFDPKTIFPYKLSEEDLNKRLQSYMELQQKVGRQRGDIKRRDQTSELKKLEKSALHQKEIDEEKIRKRNKMMRIRSLATGRGYREGSRESEEQEFSSFMITSGEGERSLSKNLLPLLTPRNNKRLF